MIEIASFLGEKLLLLILSFFVNSINTEIIDQKLDTTINVRITYHNAFVFANKNDLDKETIDPIYSLDSSYLTKKFRKYFENVPDRLLVKFVTNDFFGYVSLFYGRFYWNSDFEDFQIDVSTLKPDRNFIVGIFDSKNEYLGTLETEPYFDSIYIPQSSKNIIEKIGFSNYRSLFITAHEISHYLELLKFIKLVGKDYDDVKTYYMKHRSSESEIDSQGYYLIDKYSSDIMLLIDNYYR